MSFSLQLTPDTFDLAPGGSQEVTVELTQIDGSPVMVPLNVVSLPGQLRAGAFSESPISSDGGTATFTLSRPILSSGGRSVGLALGLGLGLCFGGGFGIASGGGGGGGALREITTIDFTGLTGTDFITEDVGLAFVISNATERLGCWFRVNEVETVPDLSALGVDEYVMFDLTDIATSDEIAQEVRTQLSFNDLTTDRTAAVVTVTDAETGAREDAADVDSGAVIAVTQQGIS